MKRRDWYILVGLLLVLLSATLYTVHYAIFRNAHHIFIYLVGDIAFIPLEVLFVALIVDQLLKMRERSITLEKLNMVIGAFFSEVGTELLRAICAFDENADEKREALALTGGWSAEDFAEIRKKLRSLEFKVDSRNCDLSALKGMLVAKRDFMVRLLENPLLLEHESFTDLLWAVFHLTEELEHRTDFSTLPQSDLAHLSGDQSRVYGLLVGQWLDYMGHLRKNYPYLYSLAARLNPFDQAHGVEVLA